jgi:nicotinate-nucleotide adenylyltransferase
MSESRRIGVLGGTFDPFHRGHLDPLLSIAGLMRWSEFLYVPAYQQPFKLGLRATSPFHRYAMVVLGIEREPRARVTVEELERGGISYSVDTIERLERQFPDTSIDWIIGDDNLDLLPRWHAIDRIFELANFVILRRGRAPLPAELERRRVLPAERPRAGGIMFADNLELEVSSTEIRRRVAEGESISDLVEPSVEGYIIRNGLYGRGKQREEAMHG